MKNIKDDKTKKLFNNVEFFIKKEAIRQKVKFSTINFKLIIVLGPLF
tara:strand:+ start:2799 stop:2939 length:141 start_codon:yes stop_codon:yes gene_type:complete